MLSVWLPPMISHTHMRSTVCSFSPIRTRTRMLLQCIQTTATSVFAIEYIRTFWNHLWKSMTLLSNESKCSILLEIFVLFDKNPMKLGAMKSSLNCFFFHEQKNASRIFGEFLNCKHEIETHMNNGNDKKMLWFTVELIARGRSFIFCAITYSDIPWRMLLQSQSQ